MDNNELSHLFNFVVLGNKDVGKSTILYKLTHETIPVDIINTIGVDFFHKKNLSRTSKELHQYH